MANLWLSTLGFLQTLGVDTHIPYTDGSYANGNLIIGDLQYLGISQVRDGITNGQNGSAPLSSYIKIAQAGIKFTFIIQASSTSALATQVALIDQVAIAVPGSVVAVEGPNEINNEPVTFNGVSGLDGALAEQKALYQAVHGDPALSGVAVDYFTGYGAGNVPVGPDPSVTPGLADFDTQHPYPHIDEPPAQVVARSTALVNELWASGPAVYTETGYSTNAVSAAVQAKYELDLLMDTASQGIAKTYLYELMDAYAPGSPQGDDGWGLFDYTKAPKPVATAIHNLTTILSSTQTSTPPGTPLGQINYTISGLPASGHSLGLTKPDESDVIVVWNEPQIWNSATHSGIVAPTVPVSLDLGAIYGLVEVFDPLIGTAPIVTYADTRTVSVGITDHPLLIEVIGTASSPPTPVPTPTPTPTPVPTPTPTPTTGSTSSASSVIGSGPDQLVLFLAETAANAKDAQFTLSVDGHPIGGVQTVTALQAQGQMQALTVNGTFGAGSHTVTVTMLNGFTGNQADIGRTLYVNAISLNGQVTFTKGAQQFNSGMDYTVQAPSAPLVSNVGTQDTLVLNVAETAVSGADARFLISVDGQLAGLVQTVTASHAAGASQAITLSGNFGAGPHTVAVDFLNGFSGAQADIGRMLYVNAITLDGTTTVENASQICIGPVSYSVAGGTASSPPTPVPTPTPTPTPVPTPTPTPTPTPVPTPTPTPTTGSTSSASSVIGSGPDQLVLFLAETAANAKDAQFTLSVDGHPIGGVQTVTALQAQGQMQALTVNGTFGAGSHTVTVTMLNGFTGNQADIGRTLYVNAISLNGQVTFTKGAQQFNSGMDYTVQAPSAPLVSNVGTQDTLVLNVAETAVSGADARFLISVDGQLAGLVQTVTASHAAGASQAITLSGNFGAGPHTVAVDFLNGFSGAQADIGRMLYVNAITLDGTTTVENASQICIGPVSYSVAGGTASSQSIIAASGQSATSLIPVSAH